jgi:hypothetical protein
MTRAELLALAERVECASGPDRELDAEIAAACYGGEIVWKTANHTMEQYPARRHASTMHVGGFCNAYVPTYTSSIDAAASLVPEGCEVKLVFHTNPAFHARAAVHRHVLDGSVPSHRGATPAIALTAAALRARAEEAPS